MSILVPSQLSKLAIVLKSVRNLHFPMYGCVSSKSAAERRTYQIVGRGKWNVQHVARWRRVVSEGVSSSPLPGASAPTDPESRRR